MGDSLSAGLRARIALEKHGFSFNRSLGQNFILDDRFMDEIVHLAEIGPEDCVLEIGPGAGVLTHCLSARCKRVLAVEIDKKLAPVLGEVLADDANAQVLFEDILRCDVAALLETYFPSERVQVVANLPYYITADAIERLVLLGNRLGNITMMVQREAAEHIAAPPGEKNYGALSALVQYYRYVESRMEVPPERFVPRPHVMSRLVTLRNRTDGVRAEDEKLLLRVIKSAFRMRRKTLVNNLVGDFALQRTQAEALLGRLDLDARIRGEMLSADQFALLANEIMHNI